MSHNFVHLIILKREVNMKFVKKLFDRTNLFFFRWVLQNRNRKEWFPGAGTVLSKRWAFWQSPHTELSACTTGPLQLYTYLMPRSDLQLSDTFLKEYRSLTLTSMFITRMFQRTWFKTVVHVVAHTQFSIFFPPFVNTLAPISSGWLQQSYKPCGFSVFFCQLWWIYLTFYLTYTI